MIKTRRVLRYSPALLVLSLMLAGAFMAYNAFIYAKIKRVDVLERQVRNIQSDLDAGISPDTNTYTTGRDSGIYARPFFDSELSAGVPTTDPFTEADSTTIVIRNTPHLHSTIPHHACLFVPLHTLAPDDLLLVSIWPHFHQLPYRSSITINHSFRARYVKANWYMPGAHLIVIGQRPAFSLRRLD